VIIVAGVADPSSLGQSASPENVSPARTDGERIAEDANIKRRAVPRLRDQRVEESPRRPFHLALQRLDRLPAFCKKRRDSRKHWAPRKTRHGGQAAKRREIKIKIRVASPWMKSPIRL